MQYRNVLNYSTVSTSSIIHEEAISVDNILGNTQKTSANQVKFNLNFELVFIEISISNNFFFKKIIIFFSIMSREMIHTNNTSNINVLSNIIIFFLHLANIFSILSKPNIQLVFCIQYNYNNSSKCFNKYFIRLGIELEFAHETQFLRFILIKQIILY